MITAASKLDAEDKRERLDITANTPILNKRYDSTCQVFVIGLVRIMKTDRMIGDFTALRTLIKKESNYVGKEILA